MTPNRHGSAVVEYPSELVIVTTRKFDAPIGLVFDVLTKPEHVRHWFAPFEDKLDRRVELAGGDDHELARVLNDCGTMSVRCH